MNIKLSAGWFYGALIVVLSVWILHSFLDALLAAGVTAVASWPLYARFRGHVRQRLPESVAALFFTFAMVVFVLAPLVFAFGAVLAEASALLQELAAVDKSGIGVPPWLEQVPLVGPWMASRWQRELAHAGAFSLLVQRTDATALLAWAQSVGQFAARHAFIVLFTILTLYFLYEEGESLAAKFKRLLRHHIGEPAETYVDLATGALRASVNSMLVVALFDGFAAFGVFAITGVGHAAVWAAITGAFALVPFLGYVAVAALSLRMALAGAIGAATVALALGSLVLLVGDKVVRPLIARNATRLHFVWILMSCLGGFEVLGLGGLVIGPVALSLARELWEQRVRDLPEGDSTHRRRAQPVHRSIQALDDPAS
ncbi:MAG: AI-2E family transporter [Burkholderiales bacterium]